MNKQVNAFLSQKDLPHLPDFQTRMEQLTNTDLEVSWKSSQASNFTITMNPPPVGFPSVLTVECGGEQPEDSAKCLAFFLLLPEGAACTANVNRKGDDAKTVSAFLQLEIAEGFSARELAIVVPFLLFLRRFLSCVRSCCTSTCSFIDA